jgi:ribosome biogenesis GTPase / thiamine phosphate phosphatase
MADVASRGGKRREAEPAGGTPAAGSTALASLPKPVAQEGLVVAVAHDFFEVVTAEGMSLCTLRGRLRKPRPPQQRKQATEDTGAAPGEDLPLRIAPGDRVRFTPLSGGQGIIEEVLPRRSLLSRARSQSGGEHVMLANLDQAVLVFAVREPVPHFGMLDRYLALCEHAGVEVTICLNKVDLGVPTEVGSEVRLYLELGYRTIYTSATTREGIGALGAQLKGRTSLLSGPSGVGKSSLMNLCLPDANQRTRQVSDSTGKGRHTTTGVRLLPLDEGGWLADSAGIRELALWNVPSEALARTFVELRPAAGECLFEDCDHSEGEGGCALREALASGAITPNRFASFLRLLAEARETEVPRW